MGFSTKGATIVNDVYKPPEPDYAAIREREQRDRAVLDEIARVQSYRESERRAAEEASRRESERRSAEEASRRESEHRSAEEASRRESERRSAEEASRMESAERIAREAQSRREHVPEDMKPKSYIRLPAYKTITPELLEAEGFTKDIAAALAKNVTGISYDANWENERAKERYGDDYIPVYKPDSQVIRSAANPEGAGPYGRAHELERKPKGEYHYSIEEAHRNLSVQFSNSNGSGMEATVKRILDLPEDKNYVSDMRLKSQGNDHLQKGSTYNVEISFTFSGKQQIGVKIDDIQAHAEYGGTRPINDIFGNKP